MTQVLLVGFLKMSSWSSFLYIYGVFDFDCINEFISSQFVDSFFPISLFSMSVCWKRSLVCMCWYGFW